MKEVPLNMIKDSKDNVYLGGEILKAELQKALSNLLKGSKDFRDDGKEEEEKDSK